MGPNGASEAAIPGNEESECPETTVEIKIKTLDSQTYSLRVNKCVPVLALKEQIASVTGILSEQQRLISQGKVLKDDQLLSAYNVEDGHTLHLVARQPTTSSSSRPGLTASETAPNNQDISHVHGGRSFSFGTLNIAGQGDPSNPDLSRIFTSVLASLGLGDIVHTSERGSESHVRPGDGSISDTSQSHIEQVIARAGLEPHEGAFQFSNAPVENQPPAVIPDSLTTLNQFLCRMRHEFIANGRVLSNSQAGEINHSGEGQGLTSQSPATARHGLPTPESLAEVILSTRQLLAEHAGGCLSELATQLQVQETVTDPRARATVQTNAVRSGVLFQNLGSLLLELGRTIMTLRMGQASTEAVVNAGPAIFVSGAAPNPIMVQAGPNFSSFPLGGGLAGGPGPGLLSRNIDIRIRRGIEESDRQQPSDPTRNFTDDPVHQAFLGESNSVPITQEPSIRVVPVRTVVAVPARVGRPPSDSSRGAVGIYYSLLARIQQNQRNTPGAGISQAPSHHSTTTVPDQLLNPGSALQANLEARSADVVRDQNPLSMAAISASSTSLSPFEFREHEQGNFQAFNSIRSASINISQNDIPQVDETLDSGVQIHTTDSSHEETTFDCAPDQSGIDPEAEVQEVSRQITDGIFFSRLLRQIMPFISQSIAVEQTDVSPRSPGSSTDNMETTSSTGIRDHRDPPDAPASKRQKIE